jgi:IGR protein motif
MTGPRIAQSIIRLPRSNPFPRTCQARWLHANRPPPNVPSPIPFVPDVQTFLKLIGRGLKQHAEKFPSWEALFTLTSPQLKELGIEQPRTRKYLLHWLHKFRRGEFGPGGDFKFVEDGEAFLKVRARPLAHNPYLERKHVVNVPAADEEETKGVVVGGYKVRGAKGISGPYAIPAIGGESASVKVAEGMWEHKQGRKIDGGERRRDEIRFKRRVAERKAQREAEVQ